MSKWYNADFEDLDWVQAPPKSFNNERDYSRKDSYTTSEAQRNFVKKCSSTRDEYVQGLPAYAAKPQNSKKAHYSESLAQNSDYTKSKNGPNPIPNKKTGKYNNQPCHQAYKATKYDDRSTDVSDETSPDRVTSNTSVFDIKVEVFGEVVIDKTNPKFTQSRYRKTKYAAACELKAPEAHEIALPSLL